MDGKHNSSKCGSYQLIQDKVEGVDYIIELLFELDVEQEPTERVIEQIFINSEKAVNPEGCCNVIDAYLSPDQTKQKNNERSKKHREGNPDYHKDWYQANKETHNEKGKQRYQTNKERLTEKFTCSICDGRHSRVDKLRHCRSKKHQEALKELENQLN